MEEVEVQKLVKSMGYKYFKLEKFHNRYGRYVIVEFIDENVKYRSQIQAYLQLLGYTLDEPNTTASKLIMDESV